MFERWQAGAAVALLLLIVTQGSAAAQPAAGTIPEPVTPGPSAQRPAVDGPTAQPEPQALPPDPRVLDLGRHLARDCSSCHRLDGVERGIPRIIGLSADRLAAALESYRREPGRAPVMASVALTLRPDEIAALAAYYASLKAP